MTYRFDKLQFSTELPNYINVSEPVTSIACTGTYLNGGGTNFSVNVPLNSRSTFKDVYAINQNTNKKTLLSNNVAIDAIWQYVSSETIKNSLTFTGNILTVTINLSNFTGGTITITPQTYTIEVLEYALPF